MIQGIWKNTGALLLLFTAGILATTNQARAGVFELGGNLSYSKSTYGTDSYTWSRRWSGNFAYHLTDVSSIEASYEDAVERDHIPGYQDTTFHDKIYSVSWVQALIGSQFFFQPFVKGGLGQLNRDATGSYANGVAPPVSTDQLTVILGGGLRMFLTQHFVLRTQVTSYIEGGRIKTYKDNIAASVGISFYF